MKIIEVASVLQRKTHYNQIGQALLPPLKLRQKGLVPATSGLSPLRDFHSIKFRPADIPVWLNASRERLLRAPRPLRLRLRCQREKRCRWLQAGKTVVVVRFASKFHRLASAFRTASIASLPAAFPSRTPCEATEKGPHNLRI